MPINFRVGERSKSHLRFEGTIDFGLNLDIKKTDKEWKF
jgi:hypothetical protein